MQIDADSLATCNDDSARFADAISAPDGPSDRRHRSNTALLHQNQDHIPPLPFQLNGVLETRAAALGQSAGSVPLEQLHLHSKCRLSPIWTLRYCVHHATQWLIFCRLRRLRRVSHFRFARMQCCRLVALLSFNYDARNRDWIKHANKTDSYQNEWQKQTAPVVCLRDVEIEKFSCFSGRLGLGVTSLGGKRAVWIVTWNRKSFFREFFVVSVAVRRIGERNFRAGSIRFNRLEFPSIHHKVPLRNVSTKFFENNPCRFDPNSRFTTNQDKLSKFHQFSTTK